MWRDRKRLMVFAGIAAVLAAIVVFRWVGSPERRLIEELRSGGPDERVRAVHALEQIGSRRAAEAIAGAAGDPETALACHAVSALGRLARPEDLGHVEAALTDGREDVRAAAVYAMSGFGDRADVDLLIRILGDSRRPARVRAAAARSLGRLKVFRATPALIHALEDPSALLRARAYAAFQQIFGVRFRFRATDPPERRREATAKMRAYYSRLKPRIDKIVKRPKDRAEGASQ